MSASPSPPAPPPGAAAPPGPAGFADLFELSLHALVKPTASFRTAAARPAPSFAACASLALLDGAAAIAINLIHTAIADPRFLDRYPPRVVAVMSAAALGVCLSLWLAAAVGLYAAGRALGGRGEFDRGLQGATAFTVLAPLLAVCNPLPYACWLAPAALLGWVANGALEGLFSTPAAPARALGALLAAAGVAGLAGTRALSDRAPELESAALLATQAADLNSQISRGIQELPAAAGNSTAAPAPMPASGLDLLRAPDDVAAGPAPAYAPAPPAAGIAATEAVVATQSAAFRQQTQGIQQNALGMLDKLAPMLDNPALNQRMTQGQRTGVAQINTLIKKIRDQVASGKPIPPAIMNAQMAEIQRLAIAVMMSQAISNSQAAPSTLKSSPPAPRLKPLDDGGQ